MERLSRFPLIVNFILGFLFNFTRILFSFPYNIRFTIATKILFTFLLRLDLLSLQVLDLLSLLINSLLILSFLEDEDASPCIIKDAALLVFR
jgi:hypothetical protein